MFTLLLRPYKFYILLSVLTLGCSSDIKIPEEEVEVGTTEISKTYTEDISDFTNPERGFYRWTSTKASNYQLLNENRVSSYITSAFTNESNYKVSSTLVFRYFLLDEFVDEPISAEFLANLETDFNTMRNAGLKMIPRFAYIAESNAGNCPDEYICPPYGDASKEIILKHIEQLGPILTKHSDVIAFLQMGFIGIWGENYYTDYFGGFDDDNNIQALTNNNWYDRIAVLNALLRATPDDMLIQVRHPQMKQKFIYGVSATTNSANITANQAFSTSDIARIGFHNDCILSSPDDVGTYLDFGNSSSPRVNQDFKLKTYMINEGKYVAMGGETCSDAYSPENDCAPLGNAENDLREMHYSYLNADYDSEVNNDWSDGGCIESIKKNLGYRLVLKEGVFTNTVNAGGNIKATLTLENIGFAAPMKNKIVRLLLIKGNVIEYFDFDVDVRTWDSEVTLSEKFKLSQSIEKGEYELFLQIADDNENLTNRSEYSIRLANTNMWNDATGYNNLNTTLQIN